MCMCNVIALGLWLVGCAMIAGFKGWIWDLDQIEVGKERNGVGYRQENMEVHVTCAAVVVM